MSEHPTAGSPSSSFGERLVRALKLDATLYEEVEHDPSSMGQAVGVVTLAALAAAVGIPGSGFLDIFVGFFLVWALAAALIWLIGVRVMACTSDYGELLRTTGFAQAPLIVLVIGVVPPASVVAVPLALLWNLVAYVIAVRQALDVSTGRAVWVCVLAVLLRIFVNAAFRALAGA